MSGAGAFGYPWITLALSSFWFVAAILQFVPHRYEPLPEPDWLVDARRAHGGGTAPQPVFPTRRREIWLGVMFILLGLMQFRRHGPDSFDRVLALFMGGGALLIALFMLVYPLLPKRTGPGWGERARQRQLERRLARGSDAYADELRSILTRAPAYRQVLSPGWQLAQTLIFALCAAGILAAGLATPR